MNHDDFYWSYKYGTYMRTPYRPVRPTRRQVLDSHAEHHIAKFRSGKITSEELAVALNRDARLYDHQR